MPQHYNSWRVSIAPMLDWTDRHYRFMARQLTRHTRLYTEMINSGAIIYGNHKQFLAFNEAEHPIALQLGGSDPHALAQCSQLAEQYGYDEVNLNCGCPSDRVQKGVFGACLMLQTQLVADCIKAMQDKTTLPITIKHRIGIDKQEDYAFLLDFVGQIAYLSNCKVFIVHARNAWLTGLSPKQNRQIPPLKYDYVYQLKRDLAQLTIVLNGGVKTESEINIHLQHVDGVMVGREAYQHPMSIRCWDQLFFDALHAPIEELQLVNQLYEYAKQQLSIDDKLHLRTIVKGYLGLFHGKPRSKIWRQTLSSVDCLRSNQAELILTAYQKMIQE